MGFLVFSVVFHTRSLGTRFRKFYYLVLFPLVSWGGVNGGVLNMCIRKLSWVPSSPAWIQPLYRTGKG